MGLLLLATIVSSAEAAGVPAWVKNNAGWWADGTISENDFLNGIQYLIKMGIMQVSSSAVTAVSYTHLTLPTIYSV